MDPFELSEIEDEDEEPVSYLTMSLKDGSASVIWTNNKLEHGSLIVINGQTHVIVQNNLSTEGDSNEVS